MGYHQWKVYGEVNIISNQIQSMFLHIIEAMIEVFSFKICLIFPRQHKLEEALLFSGRFSDALQALNDWLYRAEPQVAEDVPVGGEKDLVNNLIDKHKVLSQCMLL